MSGFPCQPPGTRRYTGCIGAACDAEPCRFGKRPSPVRERLNPMIAALRAGQPVPEPVCPDCGQPKRWTDGAHADCRRHKCERCGELFSGYGKAKYCSDICRQAALRDRRMIRRRGTTVPALPTVVWRTCVCAVCGGEFSAQGPAIRCRECRAATRKEYNKARYAERRAVQR